MTLSPGFLLAGLSNAAFSKSSHTTHVRPGNAPSTQNTLPSDHPRLHGHTLGQSISSDLISISSGPAAGQERFELAFSDYAIFRAETPGTSWLYVKKRKIGKWKTKRKAGP